MKRRGIVVVHGIGSQNRADQLDLFTEPLANFLGEAVGHDNIELNVKVPIETDDISWATIRIMDGSTVLEEWHIREAWWARSFKPSGAQSVLGWGIRAGLAIAGATVQNILLRNLRRLFGQAPGTRRTAENVLGRPWDPTSDSELPDSSQGVWNVAGAGWFRALCDALIWLLYCLFYAVVITVGLVIILPLYVFLLVPLAFFFPERVGKIQRGLVNLLVSSIGDQQAITSRRVAIAGASDVVERTLWYFIAPERIAQVRKSDPAFPGFESVTVVAHSGGCVVSYDAIASTDVRGWLAAAAVPLGPNEPPLTRPTRLNWITVGSGLNLAWRMHGRNKPRDRAFWRRIDGHVNWLNIYARYDPVPQGAPPTRMVTALVGPDPLLAGGNPADRPPYVNLRVANDDFPATDHNRYWDNSEEVFSRIVHVIADSSLAHSPIDPDQHAYLPHSDPGDPPPAISSYLSALATASTGRARRRRVTTRALGRLAGFAVIAALIAFCASDVGRWVMGTADLGPFDALNVAGHTLAGLLPERIGNVSLARYRDFLTGALVILYAGLIIQTLATLAVRLAGFLRGRPV